MASPLGSLVVRLVERWPAQSACVVAAALTSQYWLAPFKIWASHRVGAAGPDLGPVPPDHVVPAGCASLLDGHGRELEALGFRPMPLLRELGKASGSYLRLYEHPGDGSVATLIVIEKAAEAPHHGVGFTSVLAGGARVRTSNLPLPTPFPPRRGILASNFPGERDPVRLYALHRAYVAAQPEPARSLRVGDPVGFQRAEEEASLRWWQECRYMYRDGAALRPTWKGAFGIPYRLLFPWKHVNLLRDELRRRSLRARAGLV